MLIVDAEDFLFSDSAGRVGPGSVMPVRDLVNDGNRISWALCSGELTGLGCRGSGRGSSVLLGWSICDKWDDRGRGVPMLGLSLALVRLVNDGDGTRSSALSKTERSVARRDEVGLCVAAGCALVKAAAALLALAPALGPALEEGQV